jgi:hypothetical protein
MDVGVVVSPDQVSLGVLVATVPRDAVDDAVAVCAVGAKRSDGKLPPHVVAYLTTSSCHQRAPRYQHQPSDALDTGRR